MTGRNSPFQRYILPGLILQSALVSGGYGTGRELVEYFLPAGPRGGLLGMGVTVITWSVVLAVTFEFARLTRSYDYKSFFRHLLGRGWVLFELGYLMIVLLGLSVVGAAAGIIAQESSGLSPAIGTTLMMSIIGVLVFYGSATIERVLAVWSFVLYGVFIMAFIAWFHAFGDQIATSWTSHPVGDGWLRRGVQYAGYNVVGFVTVLFCLRHLEQRRDAFVAGALAGPLVMIPGALLFVAIGGFYPEINDQPLPLNYLFGLLDAPYLRLTYQVVLFGTFIETGTAMIHSINERIAESYQEHGTEMPRPLRPIVAISLLAFAVFVAVNIGIIDLIAKGYGAMGYVFLVIYMVPVMTFGVYRIFRSQP